MFIPFFCLYLRVLFFKRSLSLKFNLNENIPELIVRPADGCYFSWIDCSAIGYPFDEFYSRLIHEGKVGIMAGHVYGTEGEGYLRLNLACGREKLYMGLTRLVSVIKNINQGE